MKWKVEVCWRTNRGQGLSPVDSCEGIGNQHYFYVTNVFNLFGTVATSIFFLGVLVSNSILGGLLAVASFFFNHGEATRVQWTPSLRESFGYPIFILQILLITFVLRNNLHGFRWWLLISYLTSLFMLFWQFAGFALSTQVGSLFAVFILDFVPLNTMMTILRGHMAGFLLGFCLLFGNEMLLTSLHFSSTVTFLFILYLDPLLRRIEFRPFYLLLTSAIFVTGCLSLRVLIGRSLHIEDDAHIFDILRSKFSDFANFHTRLYTCAREFDFLGMDTVSVLMKTLLLPAAIFASFSFLIYIFRTEVPTLLWRNLERSKPYPEIMYNLIQLVCFGLMAGLIMRLKLFLTPHLCIITALLANRKLMNVSFGFSIPLWIQRTFLFALLATMAFDGFSNIKKQRNIQGEYSNIDQEKLFEWIMRNTPADAVFAGTMPVMANVKLTTNRPIVNHPHYEDVGLRARTLTVYSLFSKKPLEEVYSSLKKMGIQYYVYQQAWCSQNNPKPECTYRSMWDLQDPANVRRESLCDIIQNAVITNNETLISPIKIVYNAYNYVVFKF
ncbi:hypothetical protein AB6A40_005026 [Gnathostoma spinigerum]|uniref:Uncharacterized protein n=1 Tax=Gnathostoma spinigerum TaxID=75299 RepID=A0ABD6ENS1_9BILA